MRVKIRMMVQQMSAVGMTKAVEVTAMLMVMRRQMGIVSVMTRGAWMAAQPGQPPSAGIGSGHVRGYLRSTSCLTR
jgi:hypothetical protein